jgi:hypothetical protein
MLCWAHQHQGGQPASNVPRILGMLQHCAQGEQARLHSRSQLQQPAPPPGHGRRGWRWPQQRPQHQQLLPRQPRRPAHARFRRCSTINRVSSSWQIDLLWHAAQCITGRTAETPSSEQHTSSTEAAATAMAWALSPALAAAAAAASEVFVPAQIALCCWHSHARQKFNIVCVTAQLVNIQVQVYQPAAYFKWCHAPTAARAVVAAVAALDAAAAAAVARMAPLLNCGSAAGAAPAVGASCSTRQNQIMLAVLSSR